MSREPDLRLHARRATKRFLVDNDDAGGIIRVRWGELHDPAAGNKTFDSGGLWTLYQRTLYQQNLFRFTSSAFWTLSYKQACFSSDFTSGDIVLQRDYFDHRKPVDPLEYPAAYRVVSSMPALCFRAGAGPVRSDRSGTENRLRRGEPSKIRKPKA